MFQHEVFLKKASFSRTKPLANIGTIGHVDKITLCTATITKGLRLFYVVHERFQYF